MRRLYAVILAVVGLSACQPQPAYTPTPTRTPEPPPQATATATPVPAAPTATPMQLGPYGPDSYPDNVDPLTGLPVDDPAVLNRRPLAIKIANDVAARPQSGLSDADIVYEHYAEGDVTRYTALFYSHAPDIAGSLRSGRLIDLEIAPMYGTILVASGFSGGVQDRMKAANWVDRNFSGSFGYEKEPYMQRIQRPGLAYEHTLFAVPAELWKLADQKSVDQKPTLTPGMAFRSQPPPSDLPASRVTIAYSRNINDFVVDWQYDPASGKYLRSQAGQPDTDYLNGQQITAENVVVVGAMHVNTDIMEDSYSGLWSVEIQLWGEGPVSLFRDGYRYEGQVDAQQPEPNAAIHRP